MWEKKMNNEQIKWLNEYCEKQAGGELFFQTNAGNLQFVYKKLKELELTQTLPPNESTSQ